MGRYDNDLPLAIKAATEAGAYLKKALPEKREISKKGVVDLVTEADKNAEKMIHSIITESNPDDNFLAEEGTSHGGRKGRLWVVDPLDGTVNYAHRFPFYCVSIALVEDGEPVVGVIYNPTLDECFTAVKGEGAKLNDQPISVSKNDKLIDSLLATGFPYDIRDSENDNLCNFTMFYKRGAQAVRRAGSAALDLAYTACGRFDGFWEFKLNPWDIAAGVLLVSEAGGRVTDFVDGKVDIFKGEVLASNGVIHAQMKAVLDEAREKR